MDCNYLPHRLRISISLAWEKHFHDHILSLWWEVGARKKSFNTATFLLKLCIVIVWLLDLQLPVQSVPITINIVSLNPVHGKVYSMQHVIKVCQWLATGRWFSSATPVSSTNKPDRHDITEILLKVALNTINQTQCCMCLWGYIRDCPFCFL
jgi:hypothetical protein